MSIGEKLQNLRVDRGYTQEYVGHAVGLERSKVTKIEKGVRRVYADEIVRFCKLYQMSADELLGLKDGENTKSI